MAIRKLKQPQTTLGVGAMFAALYLALLPFDAITALKNVCLAVAFICALLSWIRCPDKRIPLAGAFLLWLAAGAASLFWSHDVSASLSAIWRDVVKSFLVFFTFFALADRQAAPIGVARIAIIGASIFAALAIYDFTVHGWADNALTPARYDVAVDALNWLVFVGLMLLAMKRPGGLPVLSWLGGAALVLLLVAGVKSQSRSFNLTVTAVLVLLAVMNLRAMLRSKPAIAVTATAIAGASILGVLLLDKPVATFWDRKLIYSTVWQKVIANPWLGTGFGHETDRAWYRDTFDGLLTPGTPVGLTHPHNLILSYMDQMGIWGLAVIVFLFWSIGRALWPASRSNDAWQRMLGQAGMLLLLATLISNTFNFYFARQHLWMFFGMLGLYLGWIKAAQSSTSA